MFAFAQKFVRSIEQSAETIISGGANDESILENDAYFSNTKFNKYGLRVLSVQPDSIGLNAGFESWFDYIIGINGHEIPTGYNEYHQLVPNYDYLIKEIENCKNRSVIFEVWCAKGGVLKNIQVNIEELSNGSSSNMDDIPLDQQPNHIIQQSFQKLGLAIQWTPLITSTFVYHVLEIHPNSPAERAGLIEHSDYIIGAQDGLLATGGEDLLGRLITSKINQSLVLYVYNHDYDVVRPVTIQPFENWGGAGVLGCGVGYGFLHRLPSVSNMGPGSVLFDDNMTPNYTPAMTPAPVNQIQENFQPINPLPTNFPPISKQNTPNSQSATPPTSATTGPPPIHGRKKKSTTVKPDLLDYLQEESEKSRQLDNQGKYPNDIDSSLPPPPKK